MNHLLYIGEVVGALRADDLTPIDLNHDHERQAAAIELRPDALAWPSLTRATAHWSPHTGWTLTLLFQRAGPLQWRYPGTDRPRATVLAHWIGLVFTAPELVSAPPPQPVT